MMDLHLSASSSTRLESVVEALRAAILAGEFQAGERLDEVKLTARLPGSEPIGENPGSTDRV